MSNVYRGVITKFRAYNPTAPVFMHCYAYVWPTGKGVLGAVVAVKSAGAMPEDDATQGRGCANALHPTPSGFELIVRKALLPELARISIR